MANLRTRVSIVLCAVLLVAASVTAARRPGPELARGPGPVGSAEQNADAAKLKNPVASTPESIAAGKTLFTRNCAPCHGINATGGSGNDISPPSPDLTDAEWQHGSTDGEIFMNIKDGIPPDLNMGPFGSQLKEPDIWNVVNYIRSIAKK